MSDPGTRANAVGLVANVLLALAKFTLGTLAGSTAVVADGFNSAGDIFATAIGWAGYRVAQAPPDDNHPYGHGNFESVAGLVVGAILVVTGAFVSVEGLRGLFAGPSEPPELLALWVALATAGVKEVLYRYVSTVGRRLNAPSLLASARDHRADVFVAVTVVGGVLGARLGWPWLDPAAAAVVGAYIAWMGWEPVRHNIGVLLDEAPADVVAEVRAAAGEVDGVRGVDNVRVHPLGSHYYVDLEIAVDGALSVHQGHELAHAVERRILDEVDHVRDVTVHVNPVGRVSRGAGSTRTGPTAPPRRGSST